METLSLGKLPPNLLEKILLKIPILDKKVIIGPGTGMDCSVIDFGDEYLVLKTDPISLTAENIGWYAVEINVNDIVKSLFGFSKSYFQQHKVIARTHYYT